MYVSMYMYISFSVAQKAQTYFLDDNDSTYFVYTKPKDMVLEEMYQIWSQYLNNNGCIGAVIGSRIHIQINIHKFS